MVRNKLRSEFDQVGAKKSKASKLTQAIFPK